MLAAALLAACGSTEKRPPAETRLPHAPTEPSAARPPAPALPSGRLIRATELLGQGYSSGHSVVVLADGTSVISGVYENTIDFGGGNLPNFSEREPTSVGLPALPNTAFGVFVAAYDPRGQHLFSKGWGPGFGGYERAYVARSETGTLTVAVQVKGEVAFSDKPLQSDGADVFLARLGANGTPTSSHRIGGKADQRCFALAVDKTNNVFVAGDFEQVIDFGSTKLKGSGAFVAAFAPDDRLLFSRALGAGTAFGLSVARDGSVFVGGDFLVRTGSIVRLDAAGVPTFQRKLESTGGSSTVHSVVAIDRDVVIAGSYWGKLDFAGLPASEPESAFIARLDSEGRPLWAHALASAGTSRTGGVAVDAKGNVAWTGFCSDDAKVGGTSLSCSGAGMANVFVASFDRKGHARWIRALGDGKPQLGRAVAFTPSGDVLVLADGYGTFKVDDASFVESRIQHSWLFRFAP